MRHTFGTQGDVCQDTWNRTWDWDFNNDGTIDETIGNCWNQYPSYQPNPPNGPTFNACTATSSSFYILWFLYLSMVSTCKRKLKMERIRTRLTMMLHIGWVTYLVRILIAMSVLTNVILGGRLNQTFSARNWDWKRNNKPNVVRLLDTLLGDGHCSRAWAYWKVRRKW